MTGHQHLMHNRLLTIATAYHISMKSSDSVPVPSPSRSMWACTGQSGLIMHLLNADVSVPHSSAKHHILHITRSRLHACKGCLFGV